MMLSQDGEFALEDDREVGLASDSLCSAASAAGLDAVASFMLAVHKHSSEQNHDSSCKMP
jgi:hypothetical protein